MSWNSGTDMSQWEICILNRYVKVFRGGDNPLPVLDAHLKKKHRHSDPQKCMVKTQKELQLFNWKCMAVVVTGTICKFSLKITIVQLAWTSYLY